MGLNLLRDIHDEAGVPVILVGLKDLPKQLASCDEQLSRRVAQVIEFSPCDLNDIQSLATTCCEVLVEKKILEEIHAQARGAMGLMVLGLSTVERQAKSQGWEAISYEQWKKVNGNKPLFITKHTQKGKETNNEKN